MHEHAVGCDVVREQRLERRLFERDVSQKVLLERLRLEALEIGGILCGRIASYSTARRRVSSHICSRQAARSYGAKKSGNTRARMTDPISLYSESMSSK